MLKLIRKICFVRIKIKMKNTRIRLLVNNFSFSKLLFSKKLAVYFLLFLKTFPPAGSSIFNININWRRVSKRKDEPFTQQNIHIGQNKHNIHNSPCSTLIPSKCTYLSNNTSFIIFVIYTHCQFRKIQE